MIGHLSTRCRSFRFALAASVVGLLALTAATASAGMIESSAFSLGYGYADPDGTEGPLLASWNTSETSAGNTPTIQGDFTFEPTLIGTQISNRGPTFFNRTLATATSYSGRSDTFGVTLAASYTGDAPSGAPLDPDYHLQINIDSIRIWGAALDKVDEDPGTIWFSETTPGNTADSHSIVLINGSGSSYIRAAFNYTQLVWDPNDPLVPYPTLGDTVTRTFALSAADRRIIEGFEVFGTVTLWIPEPASALLLIPGLLLVSRRRRAVAGPVRR